MSRDFKFEYGEYYHVFNRGVDKRKIFIDKSDKNRFQSLLSLCNDTQPVHISAMRNVEIGDVYTSKEKNRIVDIGAYCLMGNHFHILVHEKIEGGISSFMQKLATAYTMYFNIRQERTGALFEGRFKARHADNDRYLKYLFAYIHLNPVHDQESSDTFQKMSQLKQYRHSSLYDYLGNVRAQNQILNIMAFPEYFRTKKDLLGELNNWIQYESDLAI